MLLAVDGIVAGPSDDHSDAFLQAAERAAADAIGDLGVGAASARGGMARCVPRVRGEAATDPQQSRGAAAPLPDGLPRVNRLTDVYNAISVLHQVPVGGEDLARYVGAPRLIRATGAEAFVTVADGAEVVEHPDPGEVVWCDDEGVTCRRWNWRQGRRTQLTEQTTSALFILDALDPMSDDALGAATDDLVTAAGAARSGRPG